MTEFAEQAYRINRAGKLPLMVDADHGYGNALNVMRTVQELETAGVAGICIEDTLLPRALRRKETDPDLDGGRRRQDARRARRPRGQSLVIVGRTSAAAITGTEDAVRRAKAYEEAGVDALFFAGGMTREQLDAIAAAVKMPLMLGGSGRELQDRDYLSSRRVRIALQGHQPFSAAVQAVYNTLKALREGTKPGDLQGIASAEMMQRVTRDGDYKTWTEKFLGG